MKRDLRFEVTYPHPPERVWRALTDPDALREWLMDSTFSEARVGHQFEFHLGSGWKRKILRESLPGFLDRKMPITGGAQRVP